MFLDTIALSQRIKTDPSGAYLFYGQEEYLKRHWLGVIRKAVIGDDPASFNHIKIDGGDLSALEDQLDSMPMFDLTGGGSKLIELRDVDFSKLSKKELDSLCDLLRSAEGDTVVIYTLPSELPEGTKKKPSVPLSALSEVCYTVNFERQSASKLVSWLGRHFASQGCECDPDTCRFLIDYCTPDMFILSFEAKKLCAYAIKRGNKRIDRAAVKLVASPAKIYGAYDLSNALLESDLSAAFPVVADMKMQKERPENILSQITRTFNELSLIRALADGGMSRQDIASALKMNEYALGLKHKAALRYSPERLERIVGLCFEADRALKSSPVNRYLIIEDLLLEALGT